MFCKFCFNLAKNLKKKNFISIKKTNVYVFLYNFFYKILCKLIKKIKFA